MIKKQFLFLLLLPVGIAILFSSKLIIKPPAEVRGATSPSLIAVEDFENSEIPRDLGVTISHTVEEGDTLASVAKKYNADSQTIVDYPYNDIDDSFLLTVGQILIIPYGNIDKPVMSLHGEGSGVLSWPVVGEITQLESWFHEGAIDITGKTGDLIKAAASGEVMHIEKADKGYGWHVILDHGNLVTIYAHLSLINVSEGESVKRGQKIGELGQTGRSTGPHLHFEVRENGRPVDPLPLL